MNRNRLQEYLKELSSCSDDIEWISNYDDPRKAWSECDRGDWMVWLAIKQGVNPRKIAYVNYLTVKPVEYLLIHQRSKDALDAVRRYGLGEIDDKELRKHFIAAHAADAHATANAARASSSDPNNPHTYESYLSMCADICREYLTQLINFEI